MSVLPQRSRMEESEYDGDREEGARPVDGKSRRTAWRSDSPQRLRAPLVPGDTVGIEGNLHVSGTPTAVHQRN